MAFSKHLEEIIEAALADGMITDKERAVLHKKAQQEGVDPDEVDVVIDGRLQRIKQAEIEEEERRNASKQKKHECPFCHKEIPYMSAVCPNCGRVVDTSNPDNKALQKYMNKLEQALVRLKENGASKFNNKVRAELESMIRQGKSLYGDNKKINFLISEVEDSIADFESSHRKAKYIKLAIWGFIICIPILWYAYSCYEDRRYISMAQEQADSLCVLLDRLGTPTKDNYKQVEAQFLKIVWKDIPYSGNDKSVKSTIHKTMNPFKERRRSIASQIRGIYDQIYGYTIEYDNPHVPEAIEEAMYDM